MPAVTQLHHAAATQLAEASGAPRPLLPPSARPSASAADTVVELRPFAAPPGTADADDAAEPGPLDTVGAVRPQGDPDAEAARRISGIARSVAQGALEVLGGSRPLQQLARWLDPENYERLQLRANLVRCINDPPTGHGGDAASIAHRRVVVRAAQVCPVSPGVYEASVVAYDQKRVRAVALRIEQRRGAWRVTALEIG